MHVHDYFSDYYVNSIINGWANRTKPKKVEAYLLNKYVKGEESRILEAGTGGGVLSFYLESLGHRNILAFDIIPKMIKIAKERGQKMASRIHFHVADATNLEQCEDGDFEYLIYLQQILCMVPKRRLQIAMKEAYRVAKNDGTVLFSFMDWDSRWYNIVLSFIINAYRFVTFKPMSKFYLPQLKSNGKLNFRFFYSEERSIFWPKADYIIQKLKKTGFTVEAFYREEEITKKKGTAFYIVCKKQDIR